MKKIIFLSLLCCLSFGSEILLDKFEARGYLLEIREKDKKNCYLYVFKKKDKDYSFYRAFDLDTPNGYFQNRHITTEKRYNKKGQWYIVEKKKPIFKINFLDFDENYKNLKNIQKKYKRLARDTIGTLQIVCGEEIKANDKMVKKKKGRFMDFYPKAFYGDKLTKIALMKNGDIGVYGPSGKYKSFTGHISYFNTKEYFPTALTYAHFTKKYKEIPEYDIESTASICPQITPPQKYQKPMLNAKIKPYKNLAGNPIE